VYESPKNLNFSRDFLYTLGTPYTHTGLLCHVSVHEVALRDARLHQRLGQSDNPNGYLKGHGAGRVHAVRQVLDHTNFHVGPEQFRSQMIGRVNQRWIVDTTVLYTGIDKVTLAINFDFAGEENDPVLVALGTRKHNNSSWSGIAGYVRLRLDEVAPHRAQGRVLRRSPGREERHHRARAQR